MAMTTFNFRIEEELLEQLNDHCEKIQIGRAELLRRLILRELNSNDIRKISKKDIETALNNAFSSKEKLLQINYDNQSFVTKIGINTTNVYRYELTENNNVLRVRDNIGAIVRTLNL